MIRSARPFSPRTTQWLTRTLLNDFLSSIVIYSGTWRRARRGTRDERSREADDETEHIETTSGNAAGRSMVASQACVCGPDGGAVRVAGHVPLGLDVETRCLPGFFVPGSAAPYRDRTGGDGDPGAVA